MVYKTSRRVGGSTAARQWTAWCDDRWKSARTGPGTWPEHRTADQAYEGEVVYGEMRCTVKLKKGETAVLDGTLQVKKK